MDEMTGERVAETIKQALTGEAQIGQVYGGSRMASFEILLPNGQVFRVSTEELDA